MTLAQVPENSICRIASIQPAHERELNYLRHGVRAGNWLEVVCRHPVGRPRVVEVRLENQLRVSLPVSFADRVEVSPAGSDSL